MKRLLSVLAVSAVICAAPLALVRHAVAGGRALTSHPSVREAVAVHFRQCAAVYNKAADTIDDNSVQRQTTEAAELDGDDIDQTLAAVADGEFTNNHEPKPVVV